MMVMCVMRWAVLLSMGVFMVVWRVLGVGVFQVWGVVWVRWCWRAGRMFIGFGWFGGFFGGIVGRGG